MYVIYSIIIILFNTHTIWSCFGGSILFNNLELHKQKEFKPNDFTLLIIGQSKYIWLENELLKQT